jgi:hypothetical protein
MGTACPSTIDRILQACENGTQECLEMSAGVLGISVAELNKALGMVLALVGSPPPHLKTPEEVRSWAAREVAWLLQARQALLRPEQRVSNVMKDKMYEHGWLPGARYGILHSTENAQITQLRNPDDLKDKDGNVIAIPQIQLERHHPLATSCVRNAIIDDISGSLGIELSKAQRESLSGVVARGLSTVQMLAGDTTSHHGATLTRSGSEVAQGFVGIVTDERESFPEHWQEVEQKGAAHIYEECIKNQRADCAFEIDAMAIIQDSEHRHVVGLVQAENDLMTFNVRFSKQLETWCSKNVPALGQYLTEQGIELPQYARQVVERLGIQPTEWAPERREALNQRQELISEKRANMAVLDKLMGDSADAPSAQQILKTTEQLRTARYKIYESYKAQFYHGVEDVRNPGVN